MERKDFNDDLHVVQHGSFHFEVDQEMDSDDHKHDNDKDKNTHKVDKKLNKMPNEP